MVALTRFCGALLLGIFAGPVLATDAADGPETPRSIIANNPVIELSAVELIRYQADADEPRERDDADDKKADKKADQREEDESSERGPLATEPAALTPMGLYGFLGGGATNFTEPGAVGATSVGGYWDARVGVGTRSYLGAEVGYVGSARNVEALGLADDAFLLSNGVEGVARLNVPILLGDNTTLLEPYTFGGIGWNHYNVVTDSANTSSIDDSDDVMTVPLGVGIALGFMGVTLDARATYRQALDSDIFGSETSSFADTSMNSWGAGAALGFEF